MYRIKLPINFDGCRYGIEFIKGEGTTGNDRLAELLKKKGFAVEEMEAAKNNNKTKANGGDGKQ